MKRFTFSLIALTALAFFIVAFTNVKTGGMFGKITPADGASAVSIVGGADTLKAQLVQGTFTFSNLKEGVYTVLIKANAPYKDAIIDKVAVKDSATTDLGEIKLQQ
ncbi:carboxypeptidase regulatory-like domain-containing protein [Pedobacter endophyticus]|uniref:Carboxypeptidase regulatory-like domain-containing protein n=1 Tax=Pedobacter endophyticus TaxID=2789740 RepID=A0A7U3Q3C3_9SPHI|nr:carboxypeptidase regulatory-like domain-containing protein [Pedobacter endophyticus]QPH37764.1 carboxypeptidase regulatory-like domain-containing protein [Pedobacter endophyticus]